MTHLKRNDILYKWFVSIVKCVHWFNPAIYFISKQINIDCEISCDLAVVKEMDEQQEKGYIETILTLLTHNNSKGIPLTTGMTGNKKTLKRRFIMIKKRIKVSKKVAIISGILAVIILATTVFASGVLNGTFFKTHNNSIMELNTDKVTGNDFNLLFVGLDNNNRADTIMLLTVKENGIKGLSIPRNTFLEDKRISDILATENGDQELIDTIKTNLSVPIHYYAKMDLTAVKEIVDNVGGVDFEVPMDMVYEDPYQDLHINLKKGVHTLNGDGVCQLLQFRRGYPEGDLSRIQLHQQFIKEFIQQKLNKDIIDNAPEIFKVISGNTKTNYSISNLKQDMKLISAISSNNITFETISGRIAIHNEMPMYEIDFKNKTTEETNINNDTTTNVDLQNHLSVMNAFFKAFTSGNYETMKKYCTNGCENTHFEKNNNGNIFAVFGMSMAKLREVTEPNYLKGDSYVGYTVTVNCKTPKELSIVKSQNTFRVFLDKQEDNTYLISDFSY